MDFEFTHPGRPSKCTWEPNGKNSPHHGYCNKQTDWKDVMPNILHSIGQTPMVKLNHIPKKHGIKCEIFAKCEYMNPGGSIKDRIALQMIEEAERRGQLKPGYTIIEPTSGNTGVGVAMVAAVKGYRCIIVMPEQYSDEKLYTMQALGAEVVRTPMDVALDSPESVFGVSQRLQKQIPNSVVLSQFANPENPLVHYHQTAAEIWEQCNGKIDYLVGGLGTGGSIAGIGRRFRELSPSTKIVVADPRKPLSIKFFDPKDRMHNVEGIGYDFTPTVTDTNVVDMYVKTDENECFRLAREMISEEGLLCGGSSGASLSAALTIAKDLPAYKRVVILLPDTIRNYLTKFVSYSWMESKGFLDPPKPLKSNEWWWNLPVSKIPLKKPTILPSNTSYEKAVKYFQENGIHEAPMSDDKGDIKGFITLDKLLSCFISGELKHSDLATKALITQYNRVAMTTTIGRVSRIIKDSLYTVVFDEDNDNALVGILTQKDLFDFIFCRKRIDC